MPQTDEDKAELAGIVRDFLDAVDLTVQRGADVLGVPKRTLEGVVQGRGFPYPRLLIMAIERFSFPPSTSAEPTLDHVTR